MNRVIKYVGNLKLFTKIVLVMVVSITIITVTITFSTLRMSERLFIDTFSITNSKIINQIKGSFEEFRKSIVITMNQTANSKIIEKVLTEDDTSSLEMTISFFNIRKQLEELQSYLDSYDHGITLIGENGRIFSSNRIYWPIENEDLPDHPITKEAHQELNKLVYYYDQPGEGKENSPAVVVARALVNKDSNQIYGTIYISMLEMEFKKFYESYTSDGNDVFIIDHTGKIISSSNTNMVGEQEVTLLDHAKDVVTSENNYKNISFLDRNQLLLSDHLPSLDLYVVNLIDRELVAGNIIDKKTIVFISITIASLALLVILIISRQLTKSLTSLVKQISNISRSNFGNYVDVTESYETKQLATAFNYMLDELHEYVEKLIETQNKQRNAELSALQRQINPHFLYNTLASIKIMIKQGDKDKVADVINKLISLLQNTIGNVSETNTVEQELINMKNYAYINQVRYGDKIWVNYHISPDCLENEIPKLIIQPFIENAFFHAFNKKITGSIHIMIGHVEGRLVCEVVDNGDGMPKKTDHELPESDHKNRQQLFSGIGIKNVHERIQLLYGEMYGVKITSEIGKGTKIKVSLPIITPKDSHNT